MKAAFISRSTLNSVPGGDTVQVGQTAKWLRRLKVDVDVLGSNSAIDYPRYDLFHFFNLNRPADILPHLEKITKPVFVSPILVDYSEYDKHFRKGLGGFIFKNFSGDTNEFIKAVSRGLKGNDRLPGLDYLFGGHGKSIKKILARTTAVLPNSVAESGAFLEKYKVSLPVFPIPNGIDTSIFKQEDSFVKDEKLVLSVARIEGIKNQLNLVKALNGTGYTLLLIGSYAPNQFGYYRACREAAGSNIIFKDRMPQEELTGYYKKAKVHVLPSWFETCGLSSLEAASMGANIVITAKGFTRDYFGDDAFYCEPGDPSSILKAVEQASLSEMNKNLQGKIFREYTWEQAALKTLAVYQKFVQP